MTAYDRWLEEPYQQQAEKDEIIDEEVERLLSEEFNPLDVNLFLEAIMFDVLGDQAEKIEKTLTAPHPNFEALGRVIFDAVYAHWRNKAEGLAIDRFNQGLIGDDRDCD